jgi:hypothetical protein
VSLILFKTFSTVFCMCISVEFGEKLVRVVVKGCQQLHALPNSICKLRSLKHLEVETCECEEHTCMLLLPVLLLHVCC